MTSNNPFDDDFAPTGATTGPAATTTTTSGGGTNPFDDDVGVVDETVDARRDDDADHHDPAVPAAAAVSDDASSSDVDLPVEASWQFLGDLPYRRVTLFDNVRWGSTDGEPANETRPREAHHGLSYVAPDAEFSATTSTTKIAGCPNGGPIAAVTVPLHGATSTTLRPVHVRVMTPSGRLLCRIPFPPPDAPPPRRGRGPRSPSDLLELGFTDRTVLVVVTRDALVLTYDVRGRSVLPPFFATEHATETARARVFGGGAALLSDAGGCALVELLDAHDDPAYLEHCHPSARCVTRRPDEEGGRDGSSSSSSSSSSPSVTSVRDRRSRDLVFDVDPPRDDDDDGAYAVVTSLPTDAHARTCDIRFLAVAVLPRTRAPSGRPEVFLSTSDRSVVVVDASAAMSLTDVDARARVEAPITSMAFAPNGRFLACFSEESSVLTVLSTSFDTRVLDFDTSQGSGGVPPRDMVWCGEDSVVLRWRGGAGASGVVLMVGPYGDWLRFPCRNEATACLVPESDCCRVVTEDGTEILQRVPPATALFLRIGSIEPAAMLLDASDAFENGDPAADEAARAVVESGALEEAVETCAEAAVREFDVGLQKRLLRAASYGMHFDYKRDCGEGGEDGSSNNSEEKKDDDRRQIMGGDVRAPVDDDDDDALRDPAVRPSPLARRFVARARKLRVLNALRRPSVGLALTSAQFDAVAPDGVVARLVDVGRPAVARAAAEHLGADPRVVAYARRGAATRILSRSPDGLSDTAAAEAAMAALGPAADPALRGAYAAAARAARDAGRPEVAKLLLRAETSVADKVEGLLGLGAYDGAVAAAAESRDPDLLWRAVTTYARRSTAGGGGAAGQQRFFHALLNRCPPEALCVAKKYYESRGDVKSVVALLLRAGRHAEAGCFLADRANDKRDERERLNGLKEASRVFGLGKDSLFHKQCTDDYLELLFEQEKLRKTYRSAAVAPESSSVSDTLRSVVLFAGSADLARNPAAAARVLAEADRLARRFRVPDKRLWYVKIRALAETRQWTALRALADSRTKSPVGYAPFASAALEQGETAEASRYADRIADPEERFDLFLRARSWRRALDEAKRLRDTERVGQVYAACGSAEIQQLCESVAAQLS